MRIFIFVWNYQLGFLVILIQKFHYNQQETYLPELKISAFIQQWADRVFQEVFSGLWTPTFQALGKYNKRFQDISSNI